MKKIETEILEAIYEGNVEFVRSSLSARPDLVPKEFGGETWLHCAAGQPSNEMVKLLVALGCDVNEPRTLGWALSRGHIDNARTLLAHGAVPTGSHPVTSAVISDGSNACEMITLLESYGANIHALYGFGPKRVPMNALALATMHGKTDIAEYLRSRGARMPSEYSSEEIVAYIPPEASSTKTRRFLRGLPEMCTELIGTVIGHVLGMTFWLAKRGSREPKLAAQTVAYFEKHFGPVDPVSVIEIVPENPPTVVHSIAAESVCIEKASVRKLSLLKSRTGTQLRAGP